MERIQILQRAHRRGKMRLGGLQRRYTTRRGKWADLIVDSRTDRREREQTTGSIKHGVRPDEWALGARASAAANPSRGRGFIYPFTEQSIGRSRREARRESARVGPRLPGLGCLRAAPDAPAIYTVPRRETGKKRRKAAITPAPA